MLNLILLALNINDSIWNMIDFHNLGISHSKSFVYYLKYGIASIAWLTLSISLKMLKSKF